MTTTSLPIHPPRHIDERVQVVTTRTPRKLANVRLARSPNRAGNAGRPEAGWEERRDAMDTDMRTTTLDLCRLVDVRELSRLLGISVRSCWRLSALSEAGQGNGFPRPVKLGPKTVRWRARRAELPGQLGWGGDMMKARSVTPPGGLDSDGGTHAAARAQDAEGCVRDRGHVLRALTTPGDCGSI
jgi:predicted DNA-binding transcriptional regulator AlpA